MVTPPELKNRFDRWWACQPINSWRRWACQPMVGLPTHSKSLINIRFYSGPPGPRAETLQHCDWKTPSTYPRTPPKSFGAKEQGITLELWPNSCPFLKMMLKMWWVRKTLSFYRFATPIEAPKSRLFNLYPRTKALWSGLMKTIDFPQEGRLLNLYWLVVSDIFFFTPIWGRFPIWLIFFKWVETTN